MIIFERGGLLTTVQDLGRVGYQKFGMPAAGVMDPFAMQLANILVGNEQNEAVLEVTLLGPVIRFQEPVVFAVCGGDFQPRLNGVPIENNRAWEAPAGGRLELSAVRSGARGYIAFSGGLAVEPVMGSCSTCLKAAIGGLEGRAVKDGDQIGLKAPRSLSQLEKRTAPAGFGPQYSKEPVVRFTFGPQDECFTQAGKDCFVNSAYVVDSKSDRMGFRLSGPEIEKAPGSSGNIISDGICFGSIQVTNGQPIVMMADRQTVGGYPKIGCVITADLPLMAQLKGGDKVRFLPVSIQQAQKADLAQQKLLSNLKAQLDRPLFPESRYNVIVNGKRYEVSVSRAK